MDLQAIGHVNTYLKQQKMETQLALRKQSGDFTGKGASLDEYLRGSVRSDEESEEQKREKLGKIQTKLTSGGKLSEDERKFLQANDPMTYQKLVATEQEQRAYERELRRCKTREEVQRLRTIRLSSSMATVSATQNNPHIPPEKKLEIVNGERRRIDALERTTRRFVRSGRYDALPTEAEEAKVRREEAERPTAPSRSECSGQAERPDGTQRPISERGEADLSPEERRVRRAKAKSAYEALSALPTDAPTLDTQA